MEKIYLDIFNKIRENENPKIELNHFLIDEENIVVTDTRVLAIYKHKEEFDGRYLLLNKKSKIEIIADKDDGFFDAGIEIYRKKKLLNENEVIDKSEYNYNYPDYKRIIPNSKQKSFESSYTGVDALYRLSFMHGVVFDYVKFSTLMKAIDKVHFTRYVFSGKNLPVMIENDDITIVLMPLVF